MNGEFQKIEFKQNWRSDYLKVVSAFANSRGGILYIGLDDDGNTVELKNTKKLLEDIPRLKPSKNLTKRAATRDLAELVSLKIFQQQGVTGKGTQYVLRRHKGAKGATKAP